jgi:hypothetical protein
MVQRLGLACLSALLLLGCGSRRSGEPPEEFLDAPLSFGDVDNTSTCFRLRQYILYFSAGNSRHEFEPVWKKLDDVTWEFAVQDRESGPDAGVIRSRWEFRKDGNMVSVVNFDEAKDGGAPYDPSGGDFVGLTRQYMPLLQSQGLQHIQGCPDPGYLQLRRKEK